MADPLTPIGLMQWTVASIVAIAGLCVIAVILALAFRCIQAGLAAKRKQEPGP